MLLSGIDSIEFFISFVIDSDGTTRTSLSTRLSMPHAIASFIDDADESVWYIIVWTDRGGRIEIKGEYYGYAIIRGDVIRLVQDQNRRPDFNPVDFVEGGSVQSL